MLMHKNPDTRCSIKTLLEKNGYDVTEVESFEDFLEKIEQQQFDLALVDGLMPRMKILETLKEKNIKSVFFISEDVDEDELKLYENVIGFIEEPQEINEFLEKIKGMLDKK